MPSKKIILTLCTITTLLVGVLFITKKRVQSTPSVMTTKTIDSSSPHQQKQHQNPPSDPPHSSNSNESNLPHSSLAQQTSNHTAENRPDKTKSSEKNPSPPSDHSPSTIWNGKEIPFNPKAFKQAEEMVASLRTGLSHTGRGDSPDVESTKLTEALANRLGLDATQIDAFKSILLVNSTELSDQKGGYDIDKKLLDADPTDLLHLYVLGVPGVKLTADQTKYKSYLYNIIYKPIYAADGKQIEVWNKNDDVIAQLSAQLNPEQQEELNYFLAEKSLREQEKNAYDKSNYVANQLNLDNQDRATLYNFFYDNKTPTAEEVEAEINTLFSEPNP